MKLFTAILICLPILALAMEVSINDGSGRPGTKIGIKAGSGESAEKEGHGSHEGHGAMGRMKKSLVNIFNILSSCCGGKGGDDDGHSGEKSTEAPSTMRPTIPHTHYHSGSLLEHLREDYKICLKNHNGAYTNATMTAEVLRCTVEYGLLPNTNNVPGAIAADVNNLMICIANKTSSMGPYTREQVVGALDPCLPVPASAADKLGWRQYVINSVNNCVAAKGASMVWSLEGFSAVVVECAANEGYVDNSGSSPVIPVKVAHVFDRMKTCLGAEISSWSFYTLPPALIKCADQIV